MQNLTDDDEMTIDLGEARDLAAARMPLTTAACPGNALLLEEIGSTNTLARELVAHGVPVDVVAADRQVAGRGRLGHTWVSGAGESFTVTFVHRVPCAIATDPGVNGWLQMVAGLVVLMTLRGTVNRACREGGLTPVRGGIPVQLKWPNDLYCGGRKLGGILAEMVEPPACGATGGADADGGVDGSDANGGDVAIVFGIGINLDVPADRLPTPQATSLQLCVPGIVAWAGGADRLRDRIAADIARLLGQYLGTFVRSPRMAAGGLHDRVQAVCWSLGKQVEAHFTDGSTLRGEAVSLGADASLMVRDADGAVHVVRTADVGVLA